MLIRKATRKKAKLRLGIAAPSGAGKTYSALLMAFGLGGKVGLIDTENGSGDLYAHLGDYDIITMQEPYEIKKYIAAVKAFEEAGYSSIIIDSLSHAWAGSGGLLDKVGKMSGNSYTNWRTITPEHNLLVETILQSKCHVIATMRSKTEYVLEENDKGKQVPKKVGMAPVQREGMDYEFTVMLDIDQSHNAKTSKDRTGLFDGRIFPVTKKTGEELLSWLESGVSVEDAEKLQKEAQDKIYNEILKELNGCMTVEKLSSVWSARKSEILTLPEDLKADLTQKKDESKAELLKIKNPIEEQLESAKNLLMAG